MEVGVAFAEVAEVTHRQACRGLADRAGFETAQNRRQEPSGGSTHAWLNQYQNSTEADGCDVSRAISLSSQASRLRNQHSKRIANGKP